MATNAESQIALVTISELEMETTLILEYRTRLISDVVTGKLDVGDIVVPEYEAVEETVDVMVSE